MWEIIKEILSYIDVFVDFELFSFGQYSLKVYHILIVLLAYLVKRILYNILRRWLDIKVKNQTLDVGNEYAILTIANYLLWVFFLVASLEFLGIDVTILTAGSAAILVGLGLGVQQIFMDFLSGIVLLLEGDSKVGDVIEFDNKLGTIKKIGIRTSEVATAQDTVMIVPNSKLITDYVINWSHTDHTARFHVTVGVSYQSDPRVVKKLLLECVEIDERILKDPNPFVRFDDFGDSSLQFSVFFWTPKIMLFEDIRSDIRFRIFEKFQEHKIEIPFPQRVIHMKSSE